MEKSKPKSKSKSGGKMASKDAFKYLGLPASASIEQINETFTKKLADLQKRYTDKPEQLVEEADLLYTAYRSAFLSKDGAYEEDMLPLTLVGPEAMLNLFGIQDVPHQSLKVQMQSQAQYKDGQLVKKESSKTESFINKDGKRETKVYENGRLILHTIDGKSQLGRN